MITLVVILTTLSFIDVMASNHTSDTSVIRELHILVISQSKMGIYPVMEDVGNSLEFSADLVVGNKDKLTKNRLLNELKQYRLKFHWNFMTETTSHVEQVSLKLSCQLRVSVYISY